jgi:hypothetical protein
MAAWLGTPPTAMAKRSNSLTSRHTSYVRLVLIAVVMGIIPGLRAEPYGVDRYLFTGGGGTSSGGGYTLTSSIGQPEAGKLTGGAFTLEGGFWPGLIVPSEAAPTLLIEPAGLMVAISWWPEAGGFVLEASNELSPAAWQEGPPGNPVAIPVATQTRFFRLKKP